MMGAKLKDWDKKKEEVEDEESEVMAPKRKRSKV